MLKDDKGFFTNKNKLHRNIQTSKCYLLTFPRKFTVNGLT